MWLDMLTKPLQGQQFRQMQSMVMNCTINYKESNYSNKSKARMMIYQDKPETPSLECVGKDGEMQPMTIVGLQQELPPTILQSKDRPKIQNLNKFQDTHDMVEKEDTRGTGIENNLQPIKKVRWKDDADTISATEKDGQD